VAGVGGSRRQSAPLARDRYADSKKGMGSAPEVVGEGKLGANVSTMPSLMMLQAPGSTIAWQGLWEYVRKRKTNSFISLRRCGSNSIYQMSRAGEQALSSRSLLPLGR